MRPVQTKVDPNTFVPPAVRRNAELAEAAFRAQGGQPAEAPPAEVPVQSPTDPEPPIQTPPPEPAPPPSAAPRAEVTFGGNSGVPEETWEHKFKSEEGRWRRARDDVRAMSDQIASMQQMISVLQNKSLASDTPPELRPQSLLTPEERNEYGDEFLGVVARRAKEELSPEVQALQHKLSTLERRLDGTTQQTHAEARAKMEATLDQRIPVWRDVNFMDEFKQWLALPDPFSGAIRHNLLRAAYEQNDTPRVAAFFNGFLAQEAASIPGQTGPDNAYQNGGKVPLETFAAPGRAKTAAASGAPAEKPIFTSAQISKFYADSAAGKWRGKEAEYNRIDAQIIEAGAQGRVR